MHAYFVVRSPDTHDLLFQTADLTWHAYNRWHGGLTTYGSFHYPYLHEPYGDEFLNLSDPKHVHKRAHARSYDTPLITRAYRSVERAAGTGARRDPLPRAHGLRRPLRDGL